MVSKGLLVEETNLPDGRRLTQWRQSVPIATWLYAVGVAPFAVQHAGTFDDDPIQTWVLAQDRNQGSDDFAVPSRDALASGHFHPGGAKPVVGCTMRHAVAIYAVGACCLLGSADYQSTVAASQDSEAFTYYLRYLEASATAQTLADVTPFMPEWWRSRYARADPEAQASALARIQSVGRDLAKVSLEKEESVPDGVRLHMTARAKDDLPMRGEVLLVGSRARSKSKSQNGRALDSLVPGKSRRDLSHRFHPSSNVPIGSMRDRAGSRDPLR